jgi:hypothetical protein
VFTKTSTKRKRSIIALSAALVITSSGAAFAWWSSLGTGDGVATTASSAAKLTITTGEAVGLLQPGGPDVTVPFSVTNPGNAPLMLKAIVDVTFADTDGKAWSAPTGCAPEAYRAVGVLTGGAGELAAGGTRQGIVTISMQDLESDQNACKGVALPLHISVS